MSNYHNRLTPAQTERIEFIERLRERGWKKRQWFYWTRPRRGGGLHSIQVHLTQYWVKTGTKKELRRGSLTPQNVEQFRKLRIHDALDPGFDFDAKFGKCPRAETGESVDDSDGNT